MTSPPPPPPRCILESFPRRSQHSLHRRRRFRNKKAASTSSPNSGAEKSGHSHGDGDTSFMAEMEEGCDETMRHESVAAEGSHAAIFTPLQEVSDGEAPP